MDHEMRISLSRCWLQWCRIGLLASTRRGLNASSPVAELLLPGPDMTLFTANTQEYLYESSLPGCGAMPCYIYTEEKTNNFIYRQRLF